MKALDFTIKCIPMRIPTDTEWACLQQVLSQPPHEAFDFERGGRLDSLIHWSDAFFWVNASMGTSPENGTACGYYYSNWYFEVPATSRSNFFRFRPAFDLAPGALPDVQNGERIIVGTLYMGDAPIQVPWRDERPANYHRCVGPLEMRAALDDPHYQVVALRVDNVLISDRNLLKKISYTDIEQLGLAKKHGDNAIFASIRDIQD